MRYTVVPTEECCDACPHPLAACESHRLPAKHHDECLVWTDRHARRLTEPTPVCQQQDKWAGHSGYGLADAFWTTYVVLEVLRVAVVCATATLHSDGLHACWRVEEAHDDQEQDKPQQHTHSFAARIHCMSRCHTRYLSTHVSACSPVYLEPRTASNNSCMSRGLEPYRTVLRARRATNCRAA